MAVAVVVAHPHHRVIATPRRVREDGKSVTAGGLMRAAATRAALMAPVVMRHVEMPPAVMNVRV